MAIERINNNWEGLYQDLIEWNRKYGTGIDEDITGSLENAKLVLDSFRTGLRETYDTAYALKQLGAHSENDPYYDAQADSKYQESYKLSVERQKIINEMRKNHNLWDRAPESVTGNIVGAYSKSQLEQINRELAGKLRDTGLEVHSRDGNWYTTDSSGGEVKLFHTGIDAGFVGSKSGYTVDPHQEVFAKLLKGELVTTPEQQKAFLSRTMPKFLSNLYSPSSNVDMSGMVIQGGDVVIQGGTITKETIPEIRSALASASKSLETRVIDKIVGGFSKRGSSASVSGMLRKGINSL